MGHTESGPRIGLRFSTALLGSACAKIRPESGGHPGLKPWAVMYSRFRLRPISAFSYVGQVAANPPLFAQAGAASGRCALADDDTRSHRVTAYHTRHN
jgi:fermentation-respiration switch protein FrsA (DUF1100 family)